MKKGWNRCPTQIRLQGGMDLLGVARKAMERSFLVLVEWCHQCPARDGHSVPPNTTRSTRQAFSVGTTLHFHFFRDKDKPWKTHARAHKQRELSIQEAPRSRCFAQDTSRARGSIRDGYRRPLPKKSPKKPINRMCPCEESTDERIKGQPLGQGRLMVQGILPG